MKEKLSHLWAALCLFTRLPFWRIWSVPGSAYAYASHHWMVAGAVSTALSAGLVFGLGFEWMPAPLCVLLYMVVNLFLTGAFHEDGLADFFDGFGGGHTRESILRIMKDSHIGTYGVIALIFYFGITFYTTTSWVLALQGIPNIPVTAWAIWLICVMQAIWARFLASFIVAVLPYARPAEEAKIRTVYAPWRWYNGVYVTVLAIGSYVLFQYLLPYPLPVMEIWLAAPVITLFVLYWKMRQGIQGYTGDCCGATVLLCELTMNIALCCWLFLLGIV